VQGGAARIPLGRTLRVPTAYCPRAPVSVPGHETRSKERNPVKGEGATGCVRTVKETAQEEEAPQKRTLPAPSSPSLPVVILKGSMIPATGTCEEG